MVFNATAPKRSSFIRICTGGKRVEDRIGNVGMYNLRQHHPPMTKPPLVYDRTTPRKIIYRI